MVDMFDNLKRSGSITRSGEAHSGKLCSHCKNEPATGTIQNGDGKWTRVGKGCKRAMGAPKRRNIIAKPHSEGKHSNGKTKDQSGEGKHNG